MKKVIWFLVGIIVFAILGRLGWAIYDLKSEQSISSFTPTATTTIFQVPFHQDNITTSTSGVLTGAIATTSVVANLSNDLILLSALPQIESKYASRCENTLSPAEDCPAGKILVDSLKKCTLIKNDKEIASCVDAAIEVDASLTRFVQNADSTTRTGLNNNETCASYNSKYHFSAEGTVTSAGGTITVTDKISPIYGASVNVQAGSIKDGNVTITISCEDNPPLLLTADQDRMGATFLSKTIVLTKDTSEGFHPAVRVTVPYDAAQTNSNDVPIVLGCCGWYGPKWTSYATTNFNNVSGRLTFLTVGFDDKVVVMKIF